MRGGARIGSGVCSQSHRSQRRSAARARARRGESARRAARAPPAPARRAWWNGPPTPAHAPPAPLRAAAARCSSCPWSPLRPPRRCSPPPRARAGRPPPPRGAARGGRTPAARCSGRSRPPSRPPRRSCPRSSSRAACAPWRSPPSAAAPPGSRRPRARSRARWRSGRRAPARGSCLKRSGRWPGERAGRGHNPGGGRAPPEPRPTAVAGAACAARDAAWLACLQRAAPLGLSRKPCPPRCPPPPRPQAGLHRRARVSVRRGRAAAAHPRAAAAAVALAALQVRGAAHERAVPPKRAAAAGWSKARARRKGPCAPRAAGLRPHARLARSPATATWFPLLSLRPLPAHANPQPPPPSNRPQPHVGARQARHAAAAAGADVTRAGARRAASGHELQGAHPVRLGARQAQPLAARAVRAAGRVRGPAVAAGAPPRRAARDGRGRGVAAAVCRRAARPRRAAAVAGRRTGGCARRAGYVPPRAAGDDCGVTRAHGAPPGARVAGGL